MEQQIHENYRKTSRIDRTGHQTCRHLASVGCFAEKFAQHLPDF